MRIVVLSYAAALPNRARRVPRELLLWFGGAALFLLLFFMLVRGQMDLLVATFLAGSLLILALLDKSLGILASFYFLIMLGDLRRIVTISFGQPKLDLLLLIGPFLALFFALPSLLSLRLRDLLSKAFFVLLVVMVAEVFNPQQGGLLVGFSGAIFYIAPALWFWVGRQLVSPSLLSRFLYGVILPLSVAAALLGLLQSFVGFLPYEQAWVNHYGFSSLHVGGTVRAFGFSVSPSEYGELLSLGSVIVISAALAGKRTWLLLLPLLLTAMLLVSSRGIVLKVLLATSVVYVLRSNRSIGPATFVRLGAVVSVALLGLVFGAQHLGGNAEGSEHAQGVQALVSHQTSGLAHPLDSKHSTAGWHAQLMLKGIISGFTDPVGHGLGMTTLAGGRYGSETEGTEIDFSDFFINSGLVGGIAYLFVMYGAARQGIRLLRTVRPDLALPAIACLTVTLGNWLRSGEYSTNAIACLLLGALCYSSKVGSGRGDAVILTT